MHWATSKNRPVVFRIVPQPHRHYKNTGSSKEEFINAKRGPHGHLCTSIRRQRCLHIQCILISAFIIVHQISGTRQEFVPQQIGTVLIARDTFPALCNAYSTEKSHRCTPVCTNMQGSPKPNFWKMIWGQVNLENVAEVGSGGPAYSR
jgi:hypothetical protein